MKNLGTKLLKTDRLIIRKFEESDALEVFNGYINQEKFLYYANKKKMNLKEVEDLMKKISSSYNDSVYNWVIAKHDTKEIVGSINLKVQGNDVLFNYAIDDRFSSNGFMTEALIAVRDFALNKLHVDRIFGGCVKENVASRRVMEKSEFVYTHTEENSKELSNGMHDMLFFEIKRSE